MIEFIANKYNGTLYQTRIGEPNVTAKIRELNAVIGGEGNGGVILPGVDFSYPQYLWNKLESHHPQYGMALLLSRIGADRIDIRSWYSDDYNSFYSARERIINLAFNSMRKKDFKDLENDCLKNTLASVKRIDCPTAREEAGVVALSIRHALEKPATTVALVTPDRSLARRVISELKRWNINVNDSAGKLIFETPEGSFLRLTARMICSNFSPVSILAALKHPLSSGGMSRQKFFPPIKLKRRNYKRRRIRIK